MRIPKQNKIPKKLIISVILVILVIFFIPVVYVNYLRNEDSKSPDYTTQFPVTVDFRHKVIIRDLNVDSYLENNSPLEANAFFSLNLIKSFFSHIFYSLSEFSTSRNLAFVGNERVVTITAGMRKEEVANVFGKALNWGAEDKKNFLITPSGSSLPMKEGSYYPGVYVIENGQTPSETQDLVNKRFIYNVVSKYGTSTEEKIPLEVALAVASLIQRETIGTEDMRLVSGIIWNRIFKNMNLQLDATLQYAKASTYKSSPWWPQVIPSDKYIKSPYNTYLHSGLPPTPISNPSIAAILAALNPIKTDCLFYFHDKHGDMHCASNYVEHVSLLKKYYGRGE